MAKINFSIISLFPNFFTSPLQTGLLEKAIRNKIIEIKIYDLRDFGVGRNKQVDDRPFGGGPGMVLKVDVLKKALDSVKKAIRAKENFANFHTILLDPSGKKFNQEKAISLSKKNQIILVCGHYEGVDERFREFIDEEISIGDYVLNGGETAALVIIETVSRLVPGFLGSRESIKRESFAETRLGEKSVKLLDYPVYTRPETYKGKKVPKVLLSGHHSKIEKWRQKKSLEKTKTYRPDLLQN